VGWKVALVIAAVNVFFRVLSSSLVRIGLAASVSGALAACGGAANSPLEDAPSAATGTADASTSTGFGGSQGSPSADAGSPSGTKDAGPSSPVTSKDAGASVDSGSSSSPPAKDAGIDSAAPPESDPGIECGGGLCEPGSQVCCMNGSDFNCDDATDCTSNGGLPLPCVKTADCLAANYPAGTVCCVTAGGKGGGNGGGGKGGGGDQASSVACVPAADCQGQSQTQLCAQGGTDCPAGETCTQSTGTIPPYFICE
jgi:hypothetical protein